jgi:FixJ family two-component response regulator
LKRREQEIPIMFITGQSDDAVRARALTAGAVAVLFKPFSDTVLLEALHSALAES